jgi:hypothetical protein
VIYVDLSSITKEVSKAYSLSGIGTHTTWC